MARHDEALREQKEAALKRAKDEAGGVTELAKFISENYEEITIQAVSMWKLCPPLRAAQVAAAAQAKGGKTTMFYLFPPYLPHK